MPQRHVATCLVRRLPLWVLPLFALSTAATVPSAHASADTWIWQNPLPQGNTLRAVSCPSTGLCKSVGDGGTILSWDGASWSMDVSPTTHSLRGVSCPSTGYCKAVGGGGTILSWDGVTWSADTSPTANGLAAVSCSSATQCKAVGDAGTIVSWNGSAWTVDSSGTSNPLAGVACASATACKAVGHDGVLVASGMALSWNGTSWSTDTLPGATNQLYAVSCPTASACKAVGLFGAIVSWNGTAWSTDTTSFATLRGVSCVSATQCKVAGDSGLAGGWNGATWSSETSGISLPLYGVSCATGSMCRAAGTTGKITRWNGSSWAKETTTDVAFDGPIQRVSCSSPSTCKAIASSGLALSWGGTSWTAASTGAGGVLFTDIACPSATLCKIVGFTGAIRSWNGTTWSNETSGTTQNLNAISCPSATLCKAVGDSGTILTWNGTTWTADTSGTTGQLLAIDCPSTTQCKVVGNFGVTRSWNGSTWTGDISGTATPLYGVSCPSTVLCKAVGSGGVIRSWNGTSWSSDMSGTGDALNGIDCPSTTMCKAVGNAGVVLSWDGAVWSTDTSPNANTLSGVTCPVDSPAQCVAVGASGTIVTTGIAPPPLPTFTPTSTPTPPAPTNTPTLTPTASQGGPNFVVNSAADTSDGFCDVLGHGSGNQDCTLREAIVAANANEDTSTITFAIPNGPGCSAFNVCTIALGSSLPAGTGALAIDGAGGRITIDGAGNQILSMAGGSERYLSLNALTLVNGHSVTGGGAVLGGFTDLLVTNCTFANNTANGFGAAIRTDNRTGIIANSTFLNNSSSTSGGAIAYGGGSATQMFIINSTFSGNTAGSSGSALVVSNGRTVTLRNTAIVGASTSNCAISTGGGAFSADGFNLVTDATCGSATVKTASEIGLLGLADNGGETQTIALGAGSAARDAGDPAVCAAAPVSNRDQRGYGRPAGAQCDVGAFEAGAVPPPPTATPSPTDTPDSTATPTATATATPTSVLHDSVVLPLRPLRFKLRAGTAVLTKTIKVKVQNADVLPSVENPGHTVQLTANDGECPSGTVLGLPDFDRSADGAQDSVLLAGGKAATATVKLEIRAADFTAFNRIAPARCALMFSVSSPDGGDPTPQNNTVPLEISVLDANDSPQSDLHESFIESLGPLKLFIRKGKGERKRTLNVRVGNADVLPVPENPGDTLTVTAIDGDCPPGTLGTADYDSRTAGKQNSVVVKGGKKASGKLLVTAGAADFETASAKSPARCIALVSVDGPGGDTEGTNDQTLLIIDVYDRNDR